MVVQTVSKIPCDLSNIQQMSEVVELLKVVDAGTTPQELNRLDALLSYLTLRKLEADSNSKRLGDAIILNAYLVDKDGIRLKAQHPLMYSKLESYGRLLGDAAELRGLYCLVPFVKDHEENALKLISRINKSGDKGTTLEELAQSVGMQIRDVHSIVRDLDTIGLVAFVGPFYDETPPGYRARISESGRKYVAEHPIAKLRDVLKSEENK